MQQRVSAVELIARGAGGVQPEADESEQGCYSMVAAGRSGAAMVDFRLRQGDSLALPYGYLTEALFQPSDGILLRFVAHEVRIEGRNLRALYDALLWHKVTWVRMVEEGTGATDDGERSDRPEVVNIRIQERA